MALALAGLVIVEFSSAQAADTKEKRRIFDWNAEPGSEDTNVTATLRSRRSNLTELESTLSQPLRNFNSSSPGSLDGRFAPQYRPQPNISTTKLKENQRYKNWGLEEPEVDSLKSLENWESDWAKTIRDGKSDPLNPLTAKQTANVSNLPDSLRKNPFGPKEEQLPGALRDPVGNLKKLVEGDDSLNPMPPRASFSDFFGLGEQVTQEQRDLSRKAYLDEYRQIIGASRPVSPSPASDLFATTTSAPESKTPALSPLPSVSRNRAGFPEPQLGMINPRFTPEAVPDLNSRVLNGWNPMSAPIQSPAPRETSRSREFSVPKRVF